MDEEEKKLEKSISQRSDFIDSDSSRSIFSRDPN